MTELFASVADKRVKRLEWHVADVGPWYLDAVLDDAATLSGRVEVRIGSVVLSGTVVPKQDGDFGQAHHTRVVAGAHGWGRVIERQTYHNDAGVKARTVADDAARAAGEKIGKFSPSAEKIGSDYIRPVGLASRALEDALGGALWWVDYAGVTHGGTRAEVAAKDGTYEILDFDPMTRVASLSTDDPAAIGIGSVLNGSRLSAPQTVRELELVLDEGKQKLLAWTGGDGFGGSRIARSLVAIAQRATDGTILGKWRYRVYRMADGRVELQAVRRGAGLPDALPVTMRPGVAGVWSELTAGSEVLVEFIEGDRTQPIVTGFCGDKERTQVPVETRLDASSKVLLGHGGFQPAAYKGASTLTLLPPASMQALIPPGAVMMPNGMPNPAPIPIMGQIFWAPGQTIGNITDGSSKVEVQTP